MLQKTEEIFLEHVLHKNVHIILRSVILYAMSDVKLLHAILCVRVDGYNHIKKCTHV